MTPVRETWAPTGAARTDRAPDALTTARDGTRAGSAWQVLELVSQWIRHAEAKAAAVLAGAGVTGTVLYQLIRAEPSPSWWFGATTAVATALVLCAGCGSAVALWPRTRGTGAPVGLIFFDDVSRSYPEGARYVAALRWQNAQDELFEQIAWQIWLSATVARRKYGLIRCALIALLAALALVGLSALEVIID
ncbi:hypothetical protein I0C86_10845 [Plantactinospora sp. S1510]|uniref:Pycsar effector protein domain-containing protein n=1 Tax=Plantactinospora alkalitolerans TaxID=2789879 RepID=A0ABS0GU97_9ACTN|nr:Pycsar system effector family protein [Plantactinospora alkalitolerans]MBF9129462.1 hypothetical protein [Plantactinospora alkalitolerans]